MPRHARRISRSFAAVAAAALALPLAALAQTPDGPDDPLAQFLASAPKGTLRVHALQGSAAGLSLAGDRVELDLYQNDRPFKQLTAMLDERGETTFADVPVIMGVIPVVRILHSGVTYQEPGEIMDPANRDRTIEVRVYDTTDQPPAWRITMRHAMVAPAKDILTINELVVVENPADRTWLGGPPDDRARRATVVLNLPPGARKVQLLGGFHGWCCTAFAEPTLSVQMPLMPGAASYRFSYEVPLQSGRAEVMLSAAAPTDRVMIFVPAAGFTVEASQGRVSDQAGDHGESGKLMQASAMAPGQPAGVVLTALAAPAPPRSAAVPVVVIVSAAALASAAAVMLVLRRRAPRTPRGARLS